LQRKEVSAILHADESNEDDEGPTNEGGVVTIDITPTESFVDNLEAFVDELSSMNEITDDAKQNLRQAKELIYELKN
jgi:hypothetical protein